MTSAEGSAAESAVGDTEPGDATPSWFRTKAVLVHLYTASGAVLALLMLVAAFQGEAVEALWLMFAALLMNSADDDVLARRFRVGEALPFIDGALPDNIAGYMTHALAPVVRLGLRLPAGAPETEPEPGAR